MPPEPPPPLSLRFRDDHFSFLRAIESELIGLGVRRIELMEMMDRFTHPFRLQNGFDFRWGEKVWRLNQTVPGACRGLDLIALRSQTVHSLPDCGPAHLQAPADLLTGKKGRRRFSQEFENFIIHVNS